MGSSIPNRRRHALPQHMAFGNTTKGNLTKVVAQQHDPTKPVGRIATSTIELITAHLQYGPPDAVMPALAAAVRRYSGSNLRSSLLAVANDQIKLALVATRSYRHANGFTKLVLDDAANGKLRLHVWEPGSTAEENIHEHRWHFASAVLTGSLESETWVDSFDLGAPMLQEFIYRVDARGATRRAVGRSRVALAKTMVRSAGDAYFMAPGVLHRITKTRGLTATLVFTTAPSRDWNRMLASDGIRPDVSRRPLSEVEVNRVIDMLVPLLPGRHGHVHCH